MNFYLASDKLYLGLFILNFYMVNSPLREEPRAQRAAVIPARNESSLLDWLEASGRLIARDTQELEYLEEEEEISELMSVEETTYDIEDEDEDLEDIQE
jgi:hypothetical protein